MKSNTENKKRKSTWLIGKVFLIVLVLIMLINLITPNKEISEEENRYLAKRPSITLDGVLSGSYMDRFESYLSDQFAGRSFLRKVKVGIQRLGGAKVSNGVFIGDDEYLMQDIAVPNEDDLIDNITAINKTADTYKDISFNMMIVPDAANILKDKLPSLAVTADQNALINRVKKQMSESVTWIDASKSLNEHSEEKIYYKTDHHWTSLGAFYAFKDAAPLMGIKDDVSSMFAPYPVSLDFNGTLAALSGCRLDEEEQIDIYVPKDIDKDLIVNYEEEQKKTTTIYDKSKLDTRDKYAVFLGGNSPIIDIRTLSANPGRLLIIKDSFANSFVQFLTPFYREIVMVDPRYYTGSFDDLVEVYGITDVLFLYSGNTFFKDNNISGVLNIE